MRYENGKYVLDNESYKYWHQWALINFDILGYLDEQEVLTNIDSLNNETLYAQWIIAQAMFDTGQNVNAKMKKLAGNSSATSSR